MNPAEAFVRDNKLDADKALKFLNESGVLTDQHAAFYTIPAEQHEAALNAIRDNAELLGEGAPPAAKIGKFKAALAHVTKKKK